MSDASAAERAGRGFFRAGAVGMIVVGLMHASAHLAPEPEGALLAIEAMKAFSVTALGFTWNLHDAYQTLSLSYSALSIVIGAIGLVLLHVVRPPARALRACAVLFALGAASLVAIAWPYGVAPPLYLYAGVTLLFGISGVRSRLDSSR